MMSIQPFDPDQYQQEQRQELGNAVPADAPLISTASVDFQRKLPNTPTPEVLEGKSSETPRAQERASEGQPGVPLEGQEITVPAVMTQQESPAGVIAQTPPSVHLAPSQEQPPASEQARTPANSGETATFHQERAASASTQTFPSAQPQSAREQSVATEQQKTTPHKAEQKSHPAEESASQAKGAEKKEEEEEEAGPIATFRKRRIAFKTLSRPFQVLLVLTLAQIGVVALLLATQNLPQPQISSGVIAAGRFYVVPLAAFIVLAVSLITGIWFALAGALRVHWAMRVLVLTLITGLLAYTPLTRLASITGLREEPLVTEVRVCWAQLALLALVWVWVAAVSLLRWRAQRKGAVSSSKSRSWHGWIFGMAGVPILLYYGLELITWRAYALAGLPKDGSALFLSDIGFQSYLLPSFLLLLIYWSSTDLLEWSEIIAKSIVTATRRVRMRWLLPTVTILTALGILVNELRINGESILLSLAVLGALIVLVPLVVRFARIGPDWPAQIPPLALLLGAIVLYLQFVGIDEVVVPFVAAHGLALEIVTPLDNLIAVPILLAALTTGLVLVVRGRLGKPKQGAVGLFLVMVTLLSLTLSFPFILSAAGFFTPLLQQPYSLLGGLLFFAAGGSLVWIGSLLVRRRPLREASNALSSVFLLLAGLQAMSWLGDLANGITALGARSTVLLAGLFVLTTLWDLVTSGEQVTNTDSSAFPREGRILLYLGYTLVATSLLLYIGSSHAQTTGAPAPDFFSTDSDAYLGLFLLGSPMIVLTFLLNVRRRSPQLAKTTAPQPARRVAPRMMQLGIVGSGALVLALVTAFLISNSLPRLIHTSQMLLGQATYTATSPGPGCDTGGALWTLQADAPISLRCLSTGTQITDPPKKLGFVGFSPPGNPQAKAQRYRVALQVDFSSRPGVCVGILTRISHSAYANFICANGFWDIELWLLTGGPTRVLRSGQAALSSVYTLAAIVDGPEQRLALNGTTLASVSSIASTAGNIDLAVLNQSSNTGSVILSDFVFTPLP